MDDTFWGVEFPAGHNQCADGMVRLTHFPGRTAERLVSKSAVLGTSEAGARPAVPRLRETFRATSRRLRSSSTTTLVDAHAAHEKNSLELINLLKRKLFEPYGESFDAFTLDDGWDVHDSLWEIDAKGFPADLRR